VKEERKESADSTGLDGKRGGRVPGPPALGVRDPGVYGNYQ